MLEPRHSSLELAGLLGGHLFVHGKDGNGWSEPRTEWFACSCNRSQYAFWVQENPDLPGQREFHADRPVHEQSHTAHLAQVITSILEQAWDAGRDAGELQASKPTRIDLAGDKNPYRGRRPLNIIEVRYPAGI
mgnify:FL=1